jgi:hypothetical protein
MHRPPLHPQWYGSQLVGAYRPLCFRLGVTAFPKMELLTAFFPLPPVPAPVPSPTSTNGGGRPPLPRSMSSSGVTKPQETHSVSYHEPPILNAIQALRRIFSPITFNASHNPSPLLAPKDRYGPRRYFNPLPAPRKLPALASKSPIEKSLYELLQSKACPMLLIFAQINADRKFLPSTSSNLASVTLALPETETRAGRGSRPNDKRPIML